ncbi:hypothetical protein [Staphylococcus pseudintermedius]|uniref:hypothetical protein n=1 Tax=Staphylococcus pseudintermedius TaxID=283734 RepID=UPI003F65E52E
MFINSRFGNPVLLAFSDANKPIFLSENKIICDKDSIEKYTKQKILSKRYKESIINAYPLESEWFNERFSVEDIQTVFNWKNFNKRY